MPLRRASAPQAHFNVGGSLGCFLPSLSQNHSTSDRVQMCHHGHDCERAPHCWFDTKVYLKVTQLHAFRKISTPPFRVLAFYSRLNRLQMYALCWFHSSLFTPHSLNNLCCSPKTCVKFDKISDNGGLKNVQHVST
jgi:hypothetical protein